jgi:predicted dehydrogenase
MKAAVVGYGSAGSRHARLLADAGVEVAVFDPDESRRAEAVAASFAAGALADVLRGRELAVIASPNHLHREHLEEALAAGCDVLVEKPLATESTGLEELLEEASAAGRLVGIGCNLRFVDAVERARELVAAGALGRVIRARADFGHDLRAWRPGRDFRTVYSAQRAQGGGILLDAIHEFDYLYWLFGDVTKVSCFAASRSSLEVDVEDVACALLEFASGVIAEVALDYASGVYRRGFEIVGEDATASWRWGEPTLVIEGREGSSSLGVRAVDDMYERLIADFVGAVEQRREPRTPGADGLAVLRVVDGARESASRGVAVELAEVHL